MEKRKVYSVESLYSSQLENCSRETLIALVAAYAQLYLVLDGCWYLSVKQRFGDEQVVDIDLQVWDKQVRREVDKLAKLMDFRNRDVVSLMELSALIPSAAGANGYIEIENRNDCTLNITYCPIVKTLEKEGEGREKTECEIICRRIMTNMALTFNPSIELKSIKLPPRQNQDEIYCQWQFKLKGGQ
jgi:hypothetical protein